MQANWSSLVGAFLVFEWLLRIFMLFTIPKNRKPTSATAWLMLIMLEPVIGTLVFLTIGSPRLPKHRRHLQKIADKKVAYELSKLKTIVATKNLSSTQQKTIALNNALGGLPVWKGNKIEFLDDYQKSIDLLVKDITSAKQRIFFEYYILVLDDTSEPVIAALEAAVTRGVQVYVLFDALANRSFPNTKKLKKRLTSSGILWHAMLPFKLKPGKGFTRPDLRNHRKIVVIDDTLGYTGSLNIVNKKYHRKDELYYEELVTRIQGPVVWQLGAVFRTDWHSETSYMLTAGIVPAEVGSANAQVLPSGPGYTESTNLKLYTQLAQNASKRIFIVTPYFVPDEALMTALTSAAQRGVQVIMVNSDSIDKLLVGHAQRSYYEELLQAGVKVYLYKKPVFLHTKHVTIDDDTIVVGSSNLDIRSFELDLEVSMLIYDTQSVKVLRKIEERYIAGSRQVKKASWHKRSNSKKIIENVSRLTASLQ